ncbi:MAG: LysR family transcriptional regulator [Mycobacterium sp.]
MEVSQLRCFLAVAEELHFGRAADRLHLTPSPVSRAINNLEAELGVQLFERHYHRVELTPAGSELVGPVQSVLQQIDHLKVLARRSAVSPKGLRVGVSHLAPPGDVDRFVEAIRAAAQTELSVKLATSADLLAALKADDIDIALVQLPVDDAELNTMTVFRHSLRLVMRADDPLAAADGLHLADVAHRTFTLPPVATQPAALNRVHHMIKAAGILSVVESPDADAFKLAAHIRQTAGITLALDPSLRGSAQLFAGQDYALVDLLDDIALELGAAWKSGSPQSLSAMTQVEPALRCLRQDNGDSI